jgi:serine/threonine protein kinase
MIRQIELIRPINSGRYGTVYKAYDHRVKKFRAVKVLPLKRHDMMENQNRQMIDNEIHNMMRLNGHPNIVKLHDVIREDDNVYVVQEFCQGNTLQEMIMADVLDYKAKVRAIKNVTSAIMTCHGIIFADIKPSNIMHSDETQRFKLIDFGASVNVKDTHQVVTQATPWYASPEIFETGQAHYPFDVWSIGVLTYILICNAHPFIQPTDTKYDIKVFDNPLVFPDNTPFPARDFMQAALQRNPARRLTAHQLMMHVFLYI